MSVAIQVSNREDISQPCIFREPPALNSSTTRNISQLPSREPEMVRAIILRRQAPAEGARAATSPGDPTLKLAHGGTTNIKP